MAHHNVIGVLSPWLGAFVSSPRGIYGVAARYGYQVLGIKATPQDIQPSLLASAQVDGWLVAIDTHGIEALAALGAPLVTIFASGQDAACPGVQIDNRGGMCALVSHLIDHGHTRIAFVGNLYYEDCMRRLDGYREALALRGIAFDQSLVIEVDDFTAQDGRAAVRKLLAQGMPCTAIAAASDNVAIGALAELEAAGLRAPHDIVVTGFDDVANAQFASPPLTTVRQPFDELGRVAAELLLARLAGSAVPPTVTYVPSTLAIRQSCGCRPPASLPPPLQRGAPSWREPLARRMAEIALHPLPIAEAAPQLWEDAGALIDALEAALRGEPAGAGLSEEAWRRSPLLTLDLAALLSLLGLIEEAGNELIAPNDAAARRRVSTFISSQRSAALHAHRARELEQVAYLKRQVSTGHSLGLALLGDQPGEVDYLAWLKQTQVRWGCLGLWASDGARDTLVVAGSYARDGAPPPLGNSYRAAHFPPFALLPVAPQSGPRDLVMLFPIRSASRDWGVLAVCAPPDEQLVDEDKNMDMFAALICAALEREALLASLIGQQELLRIASQHRTITENIRDLLCLLDREGVYLYASPSFEHMLGRAPAALVGRSLFEAMHPQDEGQARRQWAQISGGSGSEMLFRQRHADGSWRWLEATGAPVMRQGVQGVALVARDVTERRRLEAQLLQAQKMESMGRLAGGVAHDFNNLLTVITGYADMARANLDPGNQARSDLDEIVKATARAAAITRQLLTFARKQQIAPTVCSLNALLTDMSSLLRPLLGANVKLMLRFAPDLWSTRVDVTQMEQVLINLAVNARDAMPEGGRLTITTANMPAASRTATSGGDRVALSVSDTGEGIPPEAMAQLFEPFFTTKEPGRGTGLGLALCYGIVRQHGGEISVESTPGSGATFTISLPAVHERPALRPPESPDARPHGSETILLVEDEAAVRGLAARLLRAQGYSVLEAAHGVDALDVVARHPGPIDLLLTDVVMPQLGGPALAARLLAERPALPVLYMSGYTDGGVAPGSALIQKPFAPAELLRAVRASLDTSSAPPSRNASTY